MSIYLYGNKKVKDIIIGNKTVEEVYNGSNLIFKKIHPMINGLKLTSNYNGSTIGYTVIGSLPDIDINTSTDGINWTPWDGSNITLNNGEYRYIWNKSNTLTMGETTNQFKFTMTGSIAASGNCDSMINYAPLSNFCYIGLFQDCTALSSAPELPSNNIPWDGYYKMFKGCTNLTTAPDLPATTFVGDNAYHSMFSGCTKLTTAPVLPATNFVKGACYYEMFRGCTSLTTAPSLPATTMTIICYGGMFRECTSLRTPPALPATILSQQCYENMFYGSGITFAPTLPATTMAVNCYHNMFRSCTSLTTPPALPATTLATSCYQSMFESCSNLTSAPALPATNLAESCYRWMFYACSKIKTAPNLPSTSLVTNCYSNMFELCSTLNYIKLSYTGNFSTTYFQNWVNGVASSGTFDYNGTDITESISAIPIGWSYNNKYLKITNTSSNTGSFYFKVISGQSTFNIDLYYSYDKTNWTKVSFSQSTGTSAINISSNQTIYLWNKTNKFNLSSTEYMTFTANSGYYNISGNINSLINFSNAYDYCFYYLFNGASSITNNSTEYIILPTKNLTGYGHYQNMFANTNISKNVIIYAETFQYANSFTRMFYGSSNFKELKIYLNNATSLKTSAWLSNVFTSSGTIYYNGTGSVSDIGAPTNWTIQRF